MLDVHTGRSRSAIASRRVGRESDTLFADSDRFQREMDSRFARAAAPRRTRKLNIPRTPSLRLKPANWTQVSNSPFKSQKKKNHEWTRIKIPRPYSCEFVVRRNC